jgi:GNAT superfamily N-acetyltransferase
MITYRNMQPEDIPAGLALCRSAGWNQLARDWELFLQLNPEGCVVATDDNSVVGTVATIRYQHFFSWIGMVLVDPAYRRQGIGMQLLEKALQILQTEQTVKLDEYPVSRMVCIHTEKKWAASNARPLTKRDLSIVAAFDCKVFGADRHFLLKWMVEGAPQLAFVIEERNEIQGYCMGRKGYSYTHIGPVIAKNMLTAKNLLSAALNRCIGHSVVLDISHVDPEWKEWLTTLGFTEQRFFIRMYRGSNNFPGIPEKHFALLGPEFG